MNRLCRGTTAAAVAVVVVGAGSVAASADTTSPSPSASVDADAQALQEALAEIAEQQATDRERIGSVRPTREMVADATFDLRADDATFDLNPDDSTTTLEKTQQKEDDTVVTLTSDLLFEFGSAELTPEAATAVAKLAGDIPDGATVHVDGYTDSKGADAYNQRLSTKRANAVADVLADERDDLALKVEGHGESDPVADNEVAGEDNPAGRALNRRVEVTYPAS